MVTVHFFAGGSSPLSALEAAFALKLRKNAVARQAAADTDTDTGK